MFRAKALFLLAQVPNLILSRNASTMKALRFTKETRRVDYVQDEPKPEIRDSSEVLVKIAFCGICVTDLHIINGDFTDVADKPFILGHEISGTVEATGKKVLYLEKGDRVVINPLSYCKHCPACRTGKINFCQTVGKNFAVGINKNGGWAEYIVVPADMVYKIPKTLQLQQACLCEPLSCALHAFNKLSPIKVDDSILIAGAGTTGLLFCILLHYSGYRNVSVSEHNEARLQNIEKLGLKEFNLYTVNNIKQIQTTSPDFGFDVIIDATGLPAANQLSYSLLSNSGKLGVLGWTPESLKMTIAPHDMVVKELTILGVRLHPLTMIHAIELLKQLSSRYLDFPKLGIGEYKLSDYPKALNDLLEAKIVKAIFAI